MWPNPPETASLVRFTGEILNGKLHFLRSVNFDAYEELKDSDTREKILPWPLLVLTMLLNTLLSNKLLSEISKS